MRNAFDEADCADFLGRINKLSPTSQPRWGKMGVAKMLAHCCVTYEMVYEDKHGTPNPVKRFLLKLFLKSTVTGSKPYGKNKPTAPQFVVKDDKDFESEKLRLVEFINRTRKLGGDYFDNRESLSFGSLTRTEWSNMFSKHLDHHLTQFGV